MKKNNTMRVAAGLAVAALLSTCLVSGTFAKYTTDASSQDSARVAKFGVELVANKKAFAETYNEKNAAAASVSASENVVAPGTSGVLEATQVTGTPEVAVHVDNTAEVTLGDNWVGENGKYYCPLEVTVGNQTPLKGTTYSSAAEFKEAIEDAVKSTSNDYQVGDDITSASPSVAWKWAFEGNSDPDDTALGDAANAKIDIKVTTTVTQID